MALNNDPAYPPTGFPNTGPYRIHPDWCMGDSLTIINNNFENFDTRIFTLSSQFTTTIASLSTSIVACCSSTSTTLPPVGPPPVTPPPVTPPSVIPRIVGLVDQTMAGGNTQSNMFIVSDGTLRVVGKSSNGELGIGRDTGSTTIPRVPLFEPPLFLNEQIAAVTPQGNVTFVTTTFGRLYGAGQNNHYQLGLGDTVQRNIFVRITFPGDTADTGAPKPGAFFVKKIACGSGGNSTNLTLFALMNNGDVYSWGRQTEGQAGHGANVGAPNGSAHHIFRPRKITLINNVKNVVSGGNTQAQTTFFHKTDNTLWVTGENSLGSAGIGTLYAGAPNNIPQYGDIKFKILQVLVGAVGGLNINNNVKEIYCTGEAGNITSWVLTDTDKLLGTGFNNVGQARGSASVGNKLPLFEPFAHFVTTGENIERLVGHTDKSQTSMFALIKTATPGGFKIKGWGTNSTGTLGIGNNTATILTPTLPAPAPWESDGGLVAQICVAGDDANKATLVLDTKDRLWVTGFGNNGLLGDGRTGGSTSVNRFKQVNISPGYGKPILIRSTNTSFGGWSNFLVIVDTGKILGWGYDHPSSGQLAVDASGAIVSIPSFVQLTA